MNTKTLSTVRRTPLNQLQYLDVIDPLAMWLASLRSAQTRRAYQRDVRDFIHFLGVPGIQELAAVKRAHLLAWRTSLAQQGSSPATICRKLAAVSSLYEFLMDGGEMPANPMQGFKRPRVDSYEGKTPRLSARQAEQLLDAPPSMTEKGLRDRAILSVLLYQGLRRQELCKLRVSDFAQAREGAPHLCVRGKGGKTRYVPLHPHTVEAVLAYLKVTVNSDAPQRQLFLQAKKGERGLSESEGISADGVYRNVIKKYFAQIGVAGPNFGAHALRVTAATTALERGADLNHVKRWLGHAHISTTQLYDRRAQKLVDSPTFAVKYSS